MTTIIVQPSGTQIHIEPGETLLSGLHKAGYAYTVGCRRGGCGICKVDVVDGDFSYNRPVADSVVSEDERTDGTCLSCRAVADEDLVIEMRDASLRLVNPLLGKINAARCDRERSAGTPLEEQ
ncbi:MULTISPECIES: 2Fe-2S iron-sulfur cluster-binding protein [Janibacter]|jgi:CDP-4-dehydro-6-deoxyglucose reductase|uniref:2Fe-2S iron-sulfur cluster binding domain-containing protein n=1 Tax=Janibacter indicus TaxID=857417 RepID=A0A1L3MCR0_9MICO|nr:2Fe-2S iron-sulfur cluster-binding protein [Janibacter indicus]APH00117.1 ferredoxin [Janibacter indicus]QOK22890.1 2Fe-2S iron-sulfur cluster binding domain-containing protein [Janibacter indicus]SMC63643.1 CDP-4-dehydro-6-deoxyglucose reductase [Janibacter indicus]